jgi:hypothetical protein
MRATRGAEREREREKEDAQVPTFGKGEERGCRRTDEVGVIRREFVVQLDGVRLVDGAPERIPASNNRVDVFRAGGSGTKPKTGATPPRGKGWPTRFHFS